MSDFITLTCPNCAGKLQITDDVERFACAFCGVEHIVRRSGGIVTLKPIVEGLTRIQTGVDKTASELAITRLESEIARIEERIRNLTTAYQKKLAQLDHKYDVSKLRNGIGFVSWGADTPLWKPIIGLLLCFSCMLFYVMMPLSSPDAEPADKDSALISAIFCVGPITLLTVILLWQVWQFRRRYLQLIKKRDVESEAMRYTYLQKLSALQGDLHDKQQQLARHREIVSRFD